MMEKNQGELFAFVLGKKCSLQFFFLKSVFLVISAVQNLMWPYVNALGFSICQDAIK